MRRFAAIAFALLILAVSIIPAGAEYVPAGTAIKTADEFASMKSSGTYYLDADIELSARYKGIFTGTLNGNNHKITTSVGVFETLNGTVRDLTIDGSISSSNSIGALAVRVTKTAYVWNVENLCDITLSKACTYAGGIIGSGNTGTKIYMYNCTNRGNVYLKLAAGNMDLGGMVGSCDALYCYNCANYGDITAGGSSSHCGGIVGICVISNNMTFVDLEYCKNAGKIVSGCQAAGLCAHAGYSTNISPVGYKFYFCENSGDVTGTTYVGGICGYGYGNVGAGYVNMFCCVNTGKITSGSKSSTGFASQLAAYCNSAYNEISYCVCAGSTEITSGTTGYEVFMGTSSQSALANYVLVHDLYYLEGTTTTWFGYAIDDANVLNRVKFSAASSKIDIFTFTAEEMTSGQLCMTLNRATKHNYFNQTLGTDTCPTPMLTSEHVVYDLSQEGEVYINSEDTRLPMDEELTYPVDEEGWHEPYTEAVVTTVAPDTTPVYPIEDETTVAEETTAAAGSGCNSAVCIGIIPVIAILGLGLTKKKH